MALRRRVGGLRPVGLGICFNAGLARGQLLAAERGKPGERYILCDTQLSFRALAEAVVRELGPYRR